LGEEEIVMATIRLARPADAGPIAEIYRPAVAESAISFEGEPPSAEEMRRRMAAIQAYAPWLVVEHRGEVLGYAYGSRHRDRVAYQWSVDVTVYIRSDCHRRGLGRALYLPLLALLRLQHFHAAHAGITLPNAGSVGLHEALGFRLVGVYPAVGYKCGRWHDVGWWQLPLLERQGQPPPLRSLDEARATSGWDQALAAPVPFG
jgi:phosphinothricin acetyltransferase